MRALARKLLPHHGDARQHEAPPDDAVAPPDDETARLLEEVRAALMDEGDLVRKIAEDLATRTLA